MFTTMEAQTAQFERDMAKVVKRLERQVQKIIDGLQSVNGTLTTSASALNDALNISKDLAEALKDSGYYELAEKTLKQNTKLMNLRHDELKTLLGRERLGKIDTTTLNALNKMNFQGMSGLGESSIIRIREAIFNSVNLGLPLTQLRDELMNSTGILKHHAETYIRTAKREFSQRVEDNVAEKVGFGEDKDDIWEYSPSITQSNSHKECIWAVGKRYFTNAQKNEFNSGGGYSHSEPRWNCVHRFTITNMTYDEAFGGEETSLMKETIKAENGIRNLTNEKFIALDGNGKIIFNKLGDIDRVGISNLDILDMKQNGLQVITHNHPPITHILKGEYKYRKSGKQYWKESNVKLDNPLHPTFSSKDIELALQYDIPEIRATSPDGAFIFKQKQNALSGGKVWNKKAMGKINERFSNAYSEYYWDKDILDKFNSGVWSVEEATNESINRLIRTISKETNWDYYFEKII